MSLRCRYAARITARSITAAMNRRGGKKSEWIHLRPLARFGLKPTHYREPRALLETMEQRSMRRQMTDVWSGLRNNAKRLDLGQIRIGIRRRLNRKSSNCERGVVAMPASKMLRMILLRSELCFLYVTRASSVSSYSADRRGNPNIRGPADRCPVLG